MEPQEVQTADMANLGAPQGDRDKGVRFRTITVKIKTDDGKEYQASIQFYENMVAFRRPHTTGIVPDPKDKLSFEFE